MDIERVQKALVEADLDGWLLCDNHGSNPIARRLLGLRPERMTTRRWFYFIPRAGEPVGLVHVIEPAVLGSAAGSRRRYRSWRDLAEGLKAVLGATRRIAMEYSPGAAIPYVSRVDAGTIEMVRTAGPEVVSSADLVQFFESLWTPRQKALHDRAAKDVLATKDEAFALIRERLAAGPPIRETEVQAFVMARFAARSLEADHPAIVGVNEHASDPHFDPTAGPDDRQVKPGDLVLLDLWAKVTGEPDAVYYDTTWMAYCGSDVPASIRTVWDAVRGARDAAVAAVRGAMARGETLRGCDVDDVARGFIEARGYGPYFLHRTGHSIGTEVHGAGVNIDNLETRDERRLIPGVAFSIEPGVYLPSFGVRSEIDVFIGEREAEVTGSAQEDIARLC